MHYNYLAHQIQISVDGWLFNILCWTGMIHDKRHAKRQQDKICRFPNNPEKVEFHLVGLILKVYISLTVSGTQTKYIINLYLSTFANSQNIHGSTLLCFLDINFVSRLLRGWREWWHIPISLFLGSIIPSLRGLLELFGIRHGIPRHPVSAKRSKLEPVQFKK